MTATSLQPQDLTLSTAPVDDDGWRQAGVSLPHYSRSQYSVTRRVPLSQAQAGDLVFYFKRGTHHVGLYIGNGKMVHAANPRSGVVVSNILGPWYSSRFSGIGRVVG